MLAECKDQSRLKKYCNKCICSVSPNRFYNNETLKTKKEEGVNKKVICCFLHPVKQEDSDMKAKRRGRMNKRKKKERKENEQEQNKEDGEGESIKERKEREKKQRERVKWDRKKYVFNNHVQVHAPSQDLMCSPSKLQSK